MAKKKAIVKTKVQEAYEESSRVLLATDYPYVATGVKYQDELRGSSILYQISTSVNIIGAGVGTLATFAGQYVGVLHIRIQQAGGESCLLFDDTGGLIYVATSAVVTNADLVFVTPLYFYGAVYVQRFLAAGNATFYIDIQGRKYATGFLP